MKNSRPAQKLTALQPELLKTWYETPPEDRAALVSEDMERLAAMSENSQFKPQNVGLAQFQDNRNTLDFLAAEVCSSFLENFSCLTIVYGRRGSWLSGVVCRP